MKTQEKKLNYRATIFDKNLYDNHNLYGKVLNDNKELNITRKKYKYLRPLFSKLQKSIAATGFLLFAILLQLGTWNLNILI